MKKTLSLLLSLMLCVLCLPAMGESDHVATTQVYVSISDDTGALVMVMEPVDAIDCDKDGALTIHDALACAHAAAHPEGAEAYSAVPTEWGLSLMELWGVENGGSYGYYLNDASAWSLTDPIKEGDHVKAYAFTDLTGFTDTYAYFDQSRLEMAAGDTVVLTLTAAAFDENFAPISLPVSGATLLINGEATDILTDESGKASLTFVEAGTYTLTAHSDTLTLVPPVCVVEVK